MMEHILLLKLPPISMEAIWGDGTLTRRYHLEMADGYDIDRCPFGGGFSEECTIQNGEYKGRSLKWLYKHHPDYFGSADQRKWKDMMAISMGACWASEDLSVQVHPREDWAMEHLHAHGKSECWKLLKITRLYSEAERKRWKNLTSISEGEPGRS